MKKLISEYMMTKIVAIFYLWLFVLAALPKISTIYFSILAWIPAVMLYISPSLLKYLRKQQFRREFAEFLNQIILKMQTGEAFRSSLQTASLNLSEFSRYKFEKMRESLCFGSNVAQNTQNDPDVEYLLQYFRQAEADSHRILPRLLQLREKIKVTESLQKKINQALRQHRAQMWVLTVLYLALLFVVLHKYGWHAQSRLIMISILLYILGLYLSLRISRGFKWKV
ncbi:MAG: hypothetical protein A2Z20_07970 [Bdellovibrionales bacterium RBG_16_40_8]|nr:MAG: hypothetical protein A2Z20_07970 [Bdellovibrionales bacterium RBG_16_40_8]